jgi:hypothetical protein
MELNVRVLKKEILEKAIVYTNKKFDLNLEILDFKKESKFGQAIIKGDNLNAESAFKIGMALSERIQLLTNHRWGNI